MGMTRKDVLQIVARYQRVKEWNISVTLGNVTNGKEMWFVDLNIWFADGYGNIEFEFDTLEAFDSEEEANDFANKLR